MASTYINLSRGLTDRGFYTRVDRVNSSLYYTGQTLHLSGGTSDPIWQITRTVTSGSQTIIEYAEDQDTFDKVWDNRTNLFPTIPLNNVYSTSFDGIDEDCNGGNIHNYDIADAFTVSLWVKPQNLAATRLLFSKAGPGPGVIGWMLRHNVGGQLFLQMRTGSTNRTHTFNSTLTAGVWQQVVFTYAGGSNVSGAIPYLNAVIDTNLSGSQSLSGSMLVDQPFLLGQRNNTLYFSGLIDSVTVWNKALSQAEVTELYNGGAPTNPTEHSAAGNLVSWYRMGDGAVYPTIPDVVSGLDLTMTNMSPTNFVEDVP